MGEPIVEVSQGKLQGKVSVDVKGHNFFSFQGIPYAKPPVGDLRFRAPQPVEPWTGIKDATVEGSESIAKHMLFQTDIGSEDCLSLNVYTPELPNGKKLKPVMFWIHGGGFTSGSSKTEIYGPEFLIGEDIVLVTINYRLGFLGFMKFEDTSLMVPGNAGLKDMVLALKWVQSNIKQFNGDPKNVTIFGESAGSAACNLLVLSPVTKGLFHRAILQSGVSVNPWVIGSTSPVKIAKVLGHEAKGEKDALTFLRTVPARQFLEAQTLIKDSLMVDETRPFCPVVEKPNSEAFMTEHPLNVLLSGNYNKVPIMIGYTSHEGMLLEMINKQAGIPMEYHPTDFERAIPAYYKIQKGTDLSKTIAKKLEEFYYTKSKTPDDEVYNYYAMYSDLFFVRGIHITVREMMKSLNQPLYVYRFNLDTNLNIFRKIMDITTPGVSHADDLGYLFKTMITPEIQPNSREDIALHRVVKLWTNFAKSGNPTPPEADPLIKVKWPVASAKEFKCLDIGEELTITENPDKERMAFWDMISSLSGVNSKL